MARITKPLTHTEVKQAKPKEKVYSLNDGYGLQLRVKPNGTKSWLIDYYRPYTKKRTSLSFGQFPDISLADARNKREDARALLAKDIDPKEHREEELRQIETAHSNTLEYVAKNWLEVKKSKVSIDHAADTWRSLELHIFPHLGKFPIHKITAVKTIDILNPIAAKGSLETIKRLSQRLNEVMVFAVNSGLIDHNPLTGIRAAFPSPTKKHYPTLTPEEFPEFLQNLSRIQATLNTKIAIEWQLHTMIRPGEAAGTTWDEIDFENKLWDIPAQRMKKKKRHIVPLSTQALNLLEIMKPISAKSEYVFPALSTLKNHINASTANTAIKRMGYKNKLVAHGLRSIASTVLNEEGFDFDVVESALAHLGDNEVRNAYNRAEYIERRKPLMQWWSDYIEIATTGNISLLRRKGLKIVS